MRPGSFLAVTVAVMLAGASCTSGSPESWEAARESLEEQERSFLAALSGLDPDRTSAHFADDAVLHVANMPPVRGRIAIHEFYGNVFRFMAASEPAPERVRVAEAGDLGYTAGRVTNWFRSGDGLVEFTGKYLLVWERREGEWLIVVYSVSNNASGPSG